MRLRDRLLERFAAEHPEEAAHELAGLGAEEAAGVLALLGDEAASSLLERCGPTAGAAALERLDRDRTRELLARVSLERTTGILRCLPPDLREELCTRLPSSRRLRALLEYRAGSAGALMDPDVAALPADLEIETARRRLGTVAAHVALELYLVDPSHRLVGVAALRDVLEPTRRGQLEELARHVAPLSEGADLEAIGAHPGWLHHDTLPVVDSQGTFVGAVRSDRLRQLAREADTRRRRQGSDATLALGELFWLGITGLVSSLAPRTGEEVE